VSEKKHASRAKHSKPANRHRPQRNSQSSNKKGGVRFSESGKNAGQKPEQGQAKSDSNREQPAPRIAPRVNKKSLAAAPSLNQTPRRRQVSSAEKMDSEQARPSSSEPPSSEPPSSEPLENAPPVDPFDPSLDDDDADSIGPLDDTMLGIGSRVYPLDLDFDGVDDESPEEDTSATLYADDPSVEMRIREIEERLDGLMATVPIDALDQEPPAPSTQEASPAESAVDTAREILQSDYYQSKWGRNSLRQQTAGTDDFGRDEAYEKKLRPALEFLFKRYFRVDVEGIENIPDSGRAVVVANHSGALPFDGVMLREAVRINHPKRDELRWLAEDFSFYLPFLGVMLNRIGAVRACQENAERLLAKDHLVAVFPEGAEGIKKLYKDRYQLQRFGRGGFIRLCLRTRSPIIPCAIIGAEETNPIVYRFDNLSKLLGLDYLPITPTFPLFGPLGLLPAPTKWKIVFGEAISLDAYGPQAARDHVLVGRLAERVRSNIGDLLETTLRQRKSIWL
jgi:1-acyl-sn-glycerol-3-phosphate acyltransferase